MSDFVNVSAQVTLTTVSKNIDAYTNTSVEPFLVTDVNFALNCSAAVPVAVLNNTATIFEGFVSSTEPINVEFETPLVVSANNHMHVVVGAQDTSLFDYSFSGYRPLPNS